MKVAIYVRKLRENQSFLQYSGGIWNYGSSHICNRRHSVFVVNILETFPQRAQEFFTQDPEHYSGLGNVPMLLPVTGHNTDRDMAAHAN
jgi:hypothetical protein